MDFAAKWAEGLSYEDFLQQHGAESHRARWADVHKQVPITASQRSLVESFVREINVLVLAGAWCGDCVNQCPIFDHFSQANEKLHVRYFDRDAHPELAEALKICGGARVPVVVFLSEDMQFLGIYGDRTLAKYRQMAVDQLGPACPTGLGTDMPLLEAVTQDWLNELERIHLMLRTSPRLREKHGD